MQTSWQCNKMNTGPELTGKRKMLEGQSRSVEDQVRIRPNKTDRCVSEEGCPELRLFV